MTRQTAARHDSGAGKVKLASVPSLAPDSVLVGKDVLELVTTAMHVDPIALYREYIQNSVDAIDEARQAGVLAPRDPGKVTIELDPTTRSVRIRDNGRGLAWPKFVKRLTSIGASKKRGTPLRGFRGVGRLAGLGYAQELIFRSRVAGEELISELRWDSRSLKEALRNTASDSGISELVRSIVAYSRVKGLGYPERFFEVELRGMVRLGSDKLLNATAIAEYLAQVAPVPFSPNFRFTGEITTALREALGFSEIELRISDVSGQIYRPHRNSFPIDSKRENHFEELEIIKVPGLDGGVAAIGWILHHGYEGAIPVTSLVRGLRLRCGNLQVGDHTLLEEFFPEPRFNAWSVGELHILDRRIVPNARRDNFEQNAHLNNLLNYIAPYAREIARQCRVSSRKRQLLRQLTLEEAAARDQLAVLAQGTLSSTKRDGASRAIEQRIGRMDKIITAGGFPDQEQSDLKTRVAALRTELQRLTTEPLQASPLGHLSPAKRRMYGHLFDLVYECSANRVAAKALIDRILLKLQST